MNQRGIKTGGHPPVWAWHSVNSLGGKPDMDCANALLSGFQLMQGIDLIELEAPDHLVKLYFAPESFVHGLRPKSLAISAQHDN